MLADWLVLIPYGGFAILLALFPQSVVKLFPRGRWQPGAGWIRLLGIVLALWISFQLAVHNFK
jgi:hypothetical protein